MDITFWIALATMGGLGFSLPEPLKSGVNKKEKFSLRGCPKSIGIMQKK